MDLTTTAVVSVELVLRGNISSFDVDTFSARLDAFVNNSAIYIGVTISIYLLRLCLWSCTHIGSFITASNMRVLISADNVDNRRRSAQEVQLFTVNIYMTSEGYIIPQTTDGNWIFLCKRHIHMYTRILTQLLGLLTELHEGSILSSLGVEYVSASYI